MESACHRALLNRTRRILADIGERIRDPGFGPHMNLVDAVVVRSLVIHDGPPGLSIRLRGKQFCCYRAKEEIVTVRVYPAAGAADVQMNQNVVVTCDPEVDLFADITVRVINRAGDVGISGGSEHLLFSLYP